MNKTCTKSDKLKVISLILFLCFPVFYAFLKEVINSASLAHIVLIILCYGSFIGTFVLYHEPVYRYYVYFTLFIIGILVVYIAFNMDKNFMFESYALPSCITFFGGIIGFYFVAIQSNYESVRKALKLITIILFVYYFLYSTNIESMASYQYGYDMFFGFRMLFPCLLSLNFALEKRQGGRRVLAIIWWAIFAISLLTIFAYGSRGPLLGVAVYVVIKLASVLFLSRDLSSSKKMLIFLLILVAVMILLYNLNNILLTIGDFFESAGISSRTLNRILTHTLSYDNGRNSLYQQAVNMFNVFGHGPFSDQYFFGEGNYCHNFLIEIFFDFGLFGGTLITIFLLYNLIRIFKNSQYSDWFNLFVVFLSYCCGRLIFSGTFWTETYFWMLLALGYKVIHCDKEGYYADTIKK